MKSTTELGFVISVLSWYPVIGNFFLFFHSLVISEELWWKIGERIQQGKLKIFENDIIVFVNANEKNVGI